jgi:hypothetical protein
LQGERLLSGAAGATTIFPTEKENAMTFAKGALSVTASLSLTLLGPGLFMAFRGISQEKATGLAAVAGGITEALLSPMFWILTLACFALFFAASRLKNKALSVFFFWIPSVLFSTVGGFFLGLYVFLFIVWRFHQS